MPRMLDSEAAHRAAATLPPAIEVKTTEACTVDGKVQRKTKPAYRDGASTVPDNGYIASPSIGNATKVAPRMIRCRRQCRIPASTAERDRRAPCRKNSKAIATSLPIATQRALSPRQGSTSAMPTAARMASMKLSGRKRTSLFIDALHEVAPP